MDLKYVRSELQKLSEIIDCWNTPQEATALERDLVLEKLRKLYDAVRFGADADLAAGCGDAVAEPAPTEIPVSIDLGEILPLGSLPAEELAQAGAVSGPELGAEAGAVSGSGFGSGPGSGSEPELETTSEATLEAAEPSVSEVASPADFAAEPGTGIEPEPAFESAVPANEAMSESGPTASADKSEVPAEEGTRSESVVENAAEPAAEQAVPAPETVAESDETPEKSESIAEPAAESVIESAAGSSIEPAADRAAESVPAVGAEQVSVKKVPAKAEGHAAAAVPVAPTLFELEEETVRHRHKQRVIMSLYNTEPAAPAPKPASVPVPELTAKPASTGKPAAEAAFVPSAASDSVSVGTSDSTAGVAVSAAGTAESAVAATVFAAPVAEPAAFAAESAASQTGQGPSAPHTPFAGPQPKVSETTVTDNAGDNGDEDEPDFEEITLDEKNTSGAVLGEVINHNVQTLADTIAPPRDMASELRRSERVTDLRRAIGINDKFLMIRDLFGGDAAAYEAAIGTLNDFDDFDECMIHIAENYAWNANSDGAKFLMELLERKFA